MSGVIYGIQVPLHGPGACSEVAVWGHSSWASHLWDVAWDETWSQGAPSICAGMSITRCLWYPDSPCVTSLRCVPSVRRCQCIPTAQAVG